MQQGQDVDPPIGRPLVLEHQDRRATGVGARDHVEGVHARPGTSPGSSHNLRYRALDPMAPAAGFALKDLMLLATSATLARSVQPCQLATRTAKSPRLSGAASTTVPCLKSAAITFVGPTLPVCQSVRVVPSTCA